jgi:di/tricarboxylate transporter
MKVLILSSILILLILLIKTRIKPSILFFSFLSLYYFLNLIHTKELLSNFVNPSIITLVILLLVAGVLEKTLITDYLANLFFNKMSLMKTVFKISLISAFFSAFLNNTAIVASFIGPIKNNKKHSPSKLLIPLSFAAILGGSMTLIGTATNLIINGFVIDNGLPPIKMFDFALVGIPLVIIGIIYLTVFSDKLLPDNKSNDISSISNYFIETKVMPGSSLIGKTVKDNKLRQLNSIFLAEIIRGNNLISPVSPYEIIEKNDKLVFTGDISNIQDLNRCNKLKIFGQTTDILKENLVEVVVSHTSWLVGKMIQKVDFRNRFNAAVVAVRRGDKKLSGKIGLIELKPGDDLILAVGKDYWKNDNIKKNFYTINKLNIIPKFSTAQSFFITIIFLTAIILAATGILPLLKTMLIALFIFLISKFISPKEVKDNLNIDIIVLIGSAIGISKVLINTGASTVLADLIIKASSGYGVYGSFIGVFLLTRLLSEIITNSASAAMVFPLAYSIAVSLGVSPVPFIMAVAYGSSGSFLTPYGYQTNIMVYSAGRYKFKDYFKIGFPLLTIYSLISIILIPVFFKF